MNPFRYKPSQIAKALVASLTSAIALLGLVAIVFSSGSLASVGEWAVGAAAFLAPVLVFAKKAEPVIDSLDPPVAP